MDAALPQEPAVYLNLAFLSEALTDSTSGCCQAVSCAECSRLQACLGPLVMRETGAL